MATSATPAVLQAPILWQKIVNNGHGTTEQSLGAAGPNGAYAENLIICTGPATAPGGTYTVVVKLYDGASVSTIIKSFTLVNTVDTEQLNIFLGLNIAANAEIRVQTRTALASGATLDCTLTGRSY